jgi:hypothetical protein
VFAASQPQPNFVQGPGGNTIYYHPAPPINVYTPIIRKNEPT